MTEQLSLGSMAYVMQKAMRQVIKCFSLYDIVQGGLVITAGVLAIDNTF